MSNEIQKVETPMAALANTDGYKQASVCAAICKDIVSKTALSIAGRKYVRVEGWQAIAVAHGCIASSKDVEKTETGIRAIGEVRRITDGLVLSTAEGFVGNDEATWGQRDEYAKRAMAQTRAISRACRSAFAHVVVMMDAGLETTPAEEIPAGGFKDKEPMKAPAAKAAPIAGGHAEIVTVKITDIKTKSGTSAKGPWTRYYFKAADGQFYSTFDANLAELLREATGSDLELRIQRTDKGNNVLGIQSDSQESPADDLPMN